MVASRGLDCRDDYLYRPPVGRTQARLSDSVGKVLRCLPLLSPEAPSQRCTFVLRVDLKLESIYHL